MRILYVTHVDTDQSHGASRHVIGVTKGLASLGHEVRLIAPGSIAIPGVKRVPGAGRFHAGAKAEAAFAALAVATAAWFRPHAVYVRISASTSLVPMSLSVRLPVVLELNGPILDEMARMGRGEDRIRIVRSLLQIAIARSRAVVAASDNVGRYATEELNAGNVVVIPNGADLDVATPGDKLAARRELKMPERGKVVTMVGTLVPELRLDLLSEAHRKLPGTALLVAGDGPKADMLEAMAMTTRPSSPVVYIGPVPHEKAILAIRAADVCVNVRDGDLGMKGLEYAAVGRRQVAFRMEGSDRLAALYPPELAAVHLVDERSGIALRKALEDALDAEERLGPLPPEAIEKARAKLGWVDKAERVAALLEKCASSS